MSAAIHLADAGVPHRIFERLAWVGGHAITVEDSGYRFDRTGHLLHLRDPAIERRVLEWLGDDLCRVERKSRIWSSGRYTRYPFQANTFGLPPEVAYECVLGFVRAQLEPKRDQPRNFEEFCQQHFGAGFSRHFMIPYNSRLWGVHPREITSEWCQRFVPLPKLEDVIAGAVGNQSPELGYNTNFVYPRLGIGELALAMQRQLPQIELQKGPRAIDWQTRTLAFDSETVTYDALISTAPLDVLVALLVNAPEQVREAAAKLRCTHLYYLDVALNAPCRQDLHWVYVPEERYPFYRVGCYSHFSAAMAPPGCANLYVELADRAPPDLATLLPRVADGLVEMQLIERPEEIAFARLRRLDHAYVIFDHNYFEALATVRAFCAEAHIFPAGRYGNWNYSSMEDALIFGRDAAHQAARLCT